MKSSLDNKLEKEKAKLEQLVSEAIKKGISPSESKEILEQSRKVDVLITKYQMKMKRRRNARLND